MKKTNLFLSFAFFATALALHADTQVPSTISTDTQWEASGNPYVLQGKVTVAKGATLHIGPNVRIKFQRPAALEVQGTINAEGSAAAPVVFDMSEGELNSELFLNGATALFTNVRFVGGVFLAQDTQLHMQWFEITKGSGLYLRGATSANVKNGKIYGNATGIVMDGPVQGSFAYDTLTQNTYGLFLKNYSNLTFTYNSVHDNDRDVVNSSKNTAELGGNYWGNMNTRAILGKTQGKVEVEPVRDLKEILRHYVRTQLPEITKEMETALKDREKKQAEAFAAKNPQAPAPPTEASASAPPTTEAPAPPTETAPAPEAAAPAPPAETTAPETSVSPAAPEPSGPAGVAQVKPLPDAPHKLKPLQLPPDQGNLSTVPAHVPGASEQPNVAVGSETVNAPAAAPEAAPPVLTGSETTAPPPPAESGTLAPAESAPPPAASSNTPPPPQIDVNAPPDLDMGAPPPPVPASTQATPAPVVETVPSAPSSPADNSNVPAPPALSEQMTPPPPAAASAPQAQEPAPTPAPASVEDQQKALQSLEGVSGDIDGMQAPPLDLNLDLAPSNKAGDSSSLTLPPMKDANVAPPKDLDLPPTDDTGTLAPTK
jgi:hypothetical protein